MTKNFNTKLENATNELMELDDKLKVPTKGNKRYVMVADRVRIFRKHFGTDAIIETQVIHDGNFVRSESKIIIDGRVIANGNAEENRNFGMINKTSATEACETSSIGRALANLGLQGGEYPSGDEMITAINQQNNSNDKAVKKKIDQSSSGNKANGSSSQPGQSLPPGWDKLKKADQVQIFADSLQKATHPGNLLEIVTKFKSWKESLPVNDQKELRAMYHARNKELKGE